jgi:hypothetical protein
LEEAPDPPPHETNNTTKPKFIHLFKLITRLSFGLFETNKAVHQHFMNSA